MLYYFLKFLVNTALKVFFKSFRVNGKDNIPSSGPMIIVANHPNTFMDPMIIASILKRPVFFLAKGEVFKTAFAKWLLPKFNMIPVYRRQDGEGEMSKNEETFEKCYEHLENNGVILIFPEGISITERKLRKIKTGAARIALGAEERNDFKLNVKILQIGLNYSNANAFRSEVFIKIESPTEVKNFAEEFSRDKFKAALALTDKIKTRLEELIIHIEDEYLDSLSAKIEEIYKFRLAKELGVSLKEKEENFSLTKNIYECLQYFYEKDSARVFRLHGNVSSYLNTLNKLGLSDTVVSKGEKRKSFFRESMIHLLYVAFGFPVFIYGLLNNYLPYRIPGLVAKMISKYKEYYAPIAMVTGIFTFSIFYSLQVWLLSKYFSQPVFLILYLISLPVTGLFAYSYYYIVKEIRTQWLFISLFSKRNTMIAALISRRRVILNELNEAKIEYVAHLENSKTLTKNNS